MASEEAQQRFYTVLAAVPAGKVITYGQLAAQAGLPNGARWAGYLLRHLPTHSNLPWHRVINAQGKISFPEGSEAALQQIARLEDEGIEFRSSGRIDLKRFGIL